MPSTYTLNNGIELIGTGEQSGTWGDTTNTNLGLLDAALDGQVTITLAAAGSSGSPNALPITDGTTSNGRNRMVVFADGGDLGATAYVQLTPNDAEKIIYIRNSLSGSRSVILFQGTYNASNDYEVPAGTTAVVYFDGAGAGAVAANVFNNAYFDGLRLGSVSVTAILDEDNMASDSATALATQQSIKAYVDAQVGTVDTLAEILAIGNTTGATDIAVDSAQKVQFRDAAIYINSSVDGQLDIVADTEIQIAATTVDVNGALDVSGTALVTGVLTTTAATVSNGGGQFNGAINVGVDDTGYDVKFFGATTGKSLLWDESADSLIVTGTTTLVGTTNLDAVDIDGATQIDATVTVGVDDTGYDVKFFGATAGAYMLWDESADDLILGGAAGLSVNSTALVTGVLTTTAATVSNGGGQFNGAINVGVDDTGYDVKFFGATAGKYMLWDESADTLEVSGTVVAGAGTALLPSITTTGDLNTGIFFPAADTIAFAEGGAEVMRIDSSARLVQGTTTAVPVGSTASAQIGVHGENQIGLSLSNYAANSGGSVMALSHSRSGTVGTVGTVVQDDDSLGMVRFAGDDGTDTVTQAALIGAFVDGTPGSNDMPGRLTFSTTADGASSATERLRIDSSGNVGIGTSSPDAGLHIDNPSDGAITAILDTDNTAVKLVFRNNTETGNNVQIGADGSSLVALTNASEAMRIDSSQRVLIGYTANTSVAAFDAGLQVVGQGTADYHGAAISAVGFSNNSNGAYLNFASGRSNTAGTFTSVADDDTLGQINFAAADGTDMNSVAAIIMCQVDGAPGANDMPGRLQFYTTADGASSPTERMRIDSSGYVGIGTSSPSFALDVNHASDNGLARFTSGDADAYITISDVNSSSAYNKIGVITHDMYFNTNNSERMRITEHGSVGIGCTPDDLNSLDIQRTSKTSSNVFVRVKNTTLNEDSGYKVEANVSGALATHTCGINIVYSGVDMSHITSSGAGYRWYTDATTAAPKMSLSSAGLLSNVGGINIDFPNTPAVNALYVQAYPTSLATVFFHRDNTDAQYALSLKHDGPVDGGGTGYMALFLDRGDVTRGSITISGSSTVYATSSDYRLKEDWQLMSGASDRVLALKPVNFAWIESGTRVDGFLAHELADVVPEAVTGTKDAVGADGKPEYQGIDQSKLVPLLTAALQEALTKIETLEARITALENA
jgi:hypothetical protein